MIGNCQFVLLSSLLLLQARGSRAAAQDDAGGLNRARNLLDQRKRDEEVALLNEFSFRDPKPKGLAHALGVALCKNSEIGRGVPYLRRALGKDGGDKEASQLLGLRFCFSGKRLLGSIRSCAVNYVLGELGLSQSKVLEAIGELQQDMEINPDLPAGLITGWATTEDAPREFEDLGTTSASSQRSAVKDSQLQGQSL